MKNDPKELITVKTEIRRNKYECKIYTRQIQKRYRVVYDKRVVLPTLNTVPFGYRM